uniref:Uncharacterized protein n=1 Tax=Daphnia galeata TaxID=27404 RepID=A0A8J2RN66_9CRUS|nr:unnamed protein product [Daphnia galeata]
MKLLLVMLLVSGLLIGESRAQGPFVRFFNNIFTNFRNRLGLGVKSTTSTALLSTVTVTTTITESIGLSSPDVGFVPSIIQEPEIITEMASTDSNTFTTITEETTDVASTDNPLIINKVELPIESSTPAENDQVELEIGTEGPELDHSDASVIEALAQVMLEVPTTTPESLTTPQNVVSETEAIVIKNVPPVLNSTTFSTLAPKRTIHFTRPSWTPTFLKLANRASTSRYFFPATFRRPKVDDSAISEIELHTENFVLSPSKPLSVENSLAPRIPYVVKRHVDIESSMTALNQQQSSVLSVRAATD